MCRNTIVKLLSVGIVCWASLPTAASQSQGGSYPLNKEDLRDYSGSEAKALLNSVPPASLKARDPKPANGTCGVTAPLLSWTPGDTAVVHDLYFGKNPNLKAVDLLSPHSPLTMFYLAITEPGATYYWRVDEVDQSGTVYTGDVWCFTMWPSTPCAPAPYGIVNLCCDPVLTWPPDSDAAAYHVYFSDVASGLSPGAPGDRGTTTQTTFPLGTLRGGTTYYWRIDAITAQGVVLTGTVWSFTMPMCTTGGVLREWWLNIPGTSINDLRNNLRFLGAPDGHECLDCFEGPTDWADNYGTRLSAWLLPPTSGKYTFWIAGDDQSELWLSSDADPAHAARIAYVTGWTAAREWTKEPGQQSPPIMLQAGQKYYIEALGKEGGGGDNLAVSWQGPGIAIRTVICTPFVENPACTPLIAHSPYPPDGDAYVVPAPLLSWQAGQQALQHDVYFGDDYALVANACACTCTTVYKGRQSQTTYDPGPLVAGRTYYWRVDEVNPGNAASPWKGCVWSFTLGDCAIVIDNFETYTDANPIQLTWVGKPHPVEIERSVVHGGAQSMRMDYDNQVPPYYSEAQPTAALGTNWTVQGATVLSLWFHGRPPRFLETSANSFIMSASGRGIGGTADEFRYAWKPLTSTGAITAKVQRLDNMSAGAMAGVMIRETSDPSARHVTLVVTARNGLSLAYRLIPGGPTTVTTIPGIRAPYWVRLMRQGNTVQPEHSLDGTTWTAFLSGPFSVAISMTTSVYAGLALTSGNPDAVTTAEFSHVSTTGNVTSSWQVADIGATQPGNDPCPLYVLVEDAAGKVAVAVHPENLNAVLIDEWRQWRIPLSEFKGVNLARLQKVAIGVGGSLPDGSGRIYIDDICLR